MSKIYDEYIQIFRAEKFEDRDLELTNADLDNIIKNTNLDDVVININHDNPKMYSLGGISELKRVGNVLFAKFKEFNEAFITSLQAGLFPTRSVGLNWTKDNFADIFLEHLSFLVVGVNPAVKGMGNISFNKNGATFMYIDNIKTKQKDFIMSEEKKLIEDNAKLKIDNEALTLKSKDFAKQVDKLTKENKRIDELTKELEVFKQRAVEQKQEQFRVVIEKKASELKVEEEKAEMLETLTELAKNFTEVADFQKNIDLMNFKKTVEVETGKSEEFEVETDIKVLSKNFAELIEDQEKAEKLERENPSKFNEMRDAWLS